MTEAEQLFSLGWERSPHGTGWFKQIGESRACLAEMQGGYWRGHASRYLGVDSGIRAGGETVTGTFAFCLRYAELQAFAIEAWLAGNEAGAIEYARAAVAPRPEGR